MYYCAAATEGARLTGLSALAAAPAHLAPCSVPVESQSTAVGVVTAASYVGTALAFGLAPTLIEELGWPVSCSCCKAGCCEMCGCLLLGCTGEFGVCVHAVQPGGADRAAPLAQHIQMTWLWPPPLATCRAVGILPIRRRCGPVAALLAAPAHGRRQPLRYRRQQRQELQCADAIQQRRCSRRQHPGRQWRASAAGQWCGGQQATARAIHPLRRLCRCGGDACGGLPYWSRGVGAWSLSNALVRQWAWLATSRAQGGLR